MTKFVYYEMTVWCPNVKEEVEKAPSNSKPVLIHEFEIMKCMKFFTKFIFATKEHQHIVENSYFRYHSDFTRN